MTDIEQRAHVTLEAYAPRDTQSAMQIAEWLHASGAVDTKNPGATFAVMMQGARFGLDPISAHRAFFVDTQRKVGVYADALRGLVEASGLCERFDLLEDPSLNDCQRAVFECQRPGRTAVRVGFTQEDAKRAKLWSKSGPWSDYPDRMLIARAAAKAARLVWPDVCGGMYTRDELSSGEHSGPLVAAVIEAELVEDDQPPSAKRRPPPMNPGAFIDAIDAMGIPSNALNAYRDAHGKGPLSSESDGFHLRQVFINLQNGEARAVQDWMAEQ